MEKEKLFQTLEVRSDRYVKTGEFTPGDLTQIFNADGRNLPPNYMKQFYKVRHGVYLNKPGENLPPVARKSAPRHTPVQVVKPEMITKKEAVQRLDSSAQIPNVDPTYVPFGDYKDVEQIIKSGIFYPVLITGHSGNGKTMSIEQSCAKLKRPMIRINCTKTTDEEKLIGSKSLVDGNIVIVEGPMLSAMRSGTVILLDEFSASDPNAILCLQGIMEGKGYYFSLSGEHITPAPGFNIFLTDNTKGQGSDDGRYVGTNILNEAFLERIGTVIEQEYPPSTIERKIAMRRMEQKDCVDEDFCNDLVKWAEAIRRTFKDGGVDSVISTRRLGHIVDNFSIFRDKRKAIIQCTNRFDDMTKQAFVTLWDSIATTETMKPV